MNKTYEKVKTLTKSVFHFCCFGSTQVPYGFSHVYTRAPTRMNLAEPYFDDAMHPICDDYADVELFVAFFLSLNLISFSFVCQNSNLFQFAIDTFFWGRKKTKMQSQADKKHKRYRKEKQIWSSQINTF